MSVEQLAQSDNLELLDSTKDSISLNTLKEDEVNVLQLQLQSLKDQNVKLVKTVQDSKMEIHSKNLTNFKLIQTQHELNTQLNCIKEELIRTSNVVNTSEEKVNGAFLNVLKISKLLSNCKILLAKVSTLRCEQCETQIHNAMPSGSSSNEPKLGGLQTKHRVSPMILGLPISKPRVKLQRLVVAPKLNSEKENNSRTYNTIGNATVHVEEPVRPVADAILPIVEPALPDMEASLPVAEPITDAVESLLSVAEPIPNTVEPALPVAEPIPNAVEPTLPDRDPTPPVSDQLANSLKEKAMENHVEDINKRQMYMVELEENINDLFKYVTELSGCLFTCKESIKKLYSTPARVIDDSFKLLPPECPNISPDRPPCDIQSSRRVAPMINGVLIDIQPIIKVERLNTVGVQILNDSQSSDCSMESESDVQLSRITEENEEENRVTESPVLFTNTEINLSGTLHDHPSSQNVTQIIEGHTIISQPTVLIERFDASPVPSKWIDKILGKGNITTRKRSKLGTSKAVTKNTVVDDDAGPSGTNTTSNDEAVEQPSGNRRVLKRKVQTTRKAHHEEKITTTMIDDPGPSGSATTSSNDDVVEQPNVEEKGSRRKKGCTVPSKEPGCNHVEPGSDDTTPTSIGEVKLSRGNRRKQVKHKVQTTTKHAPSEEKATPTITPELGPINATSTSNEEENESAGRKNGINGQLKISFPSCFSNPEPGPSNATPAHIKEENKPEETRSRRRRKEPTSYKEPSRIMKLRRM